MKNYLTLFFLLSIHIVCYSTNGFIENKGQIADETGKIKQDINFKIELPHTNAYFKKDGIIYHFYQSSKKTTNEYSEKDWENYKKGDLNAISEKVYFFRIDLKLLNTNPNPVIEKKGTQNIIYNYYLSHCPQGITGVNSFDEIIYKNIYNNIDIRYYFSDNKLKYEFIVHPGGNINDIQLQYNGATSVKINSGQLIVENDFNTITEDEPYSYTKESNNKLDSQFKINNGTIGFDIKKFNSNETIIIDPTITWASYYNNNNSSDFKCNSAFDAQLNIFTCFSTYGNTWTTINAGAGQYYDAVKDGITDVVISRFNTNYSQQWVTYYGGNGGDYLCGTGGDYGKTIGVDANGNVYVGGYTNGAANNFPTLSSSTPGAFYKDQTKIYGGDTGFLLKFDGNGVRQWATMFQHEQANTSSAGMRINGICVNGSKIYFTGETYRFSNNDIPLRVLAGAYNNPTYVGDQDVFLGRFDSNCLLEWCTYFNNGNNTIKAYKQGTDLHIDASGNLLYVGQISASSAANGASAYLSNPGGGAYYMGTIAGSGDIQVAKFNSSLQPVWSTLYGSTDLDRVSEVSSDINGNILVACRTVSGNNLPTANPVGAFVYTTKQAPGTWSSNGAQDGAIIKFTPNGNLYWATYIGGTSSTTNSTPGVASDNSGNIYVIGFTNTNNFPIQNLAGSYNQPASGGGQEMVMMRFTPTGALSWSTYYGGTADESCYGLKITPSSKHGSCGFYKQFCTFSTNSSNIPTTNPGSPSFFKGIKKQTYTNGILLIEENTGSAVSTPPTNILGNTTICISNSTTLIINGGSLASGSAWTWHADSCNATPIGTGTSITVSPTTTTTYYVNAIGICDTSACVAITVTVGTNVTGSFNHSICTGSSYLFNGQNLTTSGLYKDTLTSISGCDSILTLNLTVTSPLATSFNHSICTGSSYLFNGQNLTASGMYKDTLTATGGCDSIITLNLTVTSPLTSSFNHSICTGSSYLFNGQNLTASGMYKDTLTATGGCDSIITLNLTVTSPLTSSFNHSICTGSSYLFNGQNLTTTGIYKDTLTALGGCDSIITLNLTVTNALTSSFNQSICTGNSYLFNGQNLTIAGAYKDTLTSIGGCDSIVTLNLSVTPSLTSSFNHSICTGNSYLFNGQNLTIAGAYKDTLTSIGGCDSIVTLNLTVTNALTSSFNHSICTGNSYLFNGQNLITAGAYKDTLTSIGGCDSIITLNLTILQNSFSNLNATVCSNEGYLLQNGIIVYTSGIYKDTLTAKNGCDSIITINLTVNPSPILTVSPNVTIVSGNSTTLTASGFGTFSWSPPNGLDITTGQSVIASPIQTTTYCVTLQAANGCIDTACITVTVESNCVNPTNLAVPNAFSPNKDAVNESYCLQGWDQCVKDFTITIYNRWGEKIYESKDPKFCWDGSYYNLPAGRQGTIMDSQVVVYTIYATHIVTGESFIKRGNISIIR